MKKYLVTLTEEEREQLTQLISRGKAAAKKLTHARILLKADSSPEAPAWNDSAISVALEVGTATVERIRRQFVEEGLAAALERRVSQRHYERKLDGVAEAHLVALTCSKAPEGRKEWTMQLLADRMVVLGHVQAVSRETVRRTLKKTCLNLG
jgi:transposase